MSEFYLFIMNVVSGDMDGCYRYFKPQYLEMKYENGLRPIHVATINGQVDIVKYFIRQNCELNVYTDDGKSPLDIAMENKCQEIIDILINNGEISNIATAMELECEPFCKHESCFKCMNVEYFEKYRIGFGAFGEVWKIHDSKSHRDFAMKVISVNQNFASSKEAKYVEININMYRKLMKHPRIVQYFGAIQKSNKMYIFMEYVNNGTMADKIRREGALKEKEILKYCKQLLEGLHYLHGLKIIHRDIKPDNILLNDIGDIKLADFGLSRSILTILSFKTGTANSVCGTANYMAPEIINEEPYIYTADIWSLGATMVEMILGRPPFENLNQMVIIFQIATNRKIPFTMPVYKSKKISIVLNRMLQSNPIDRGTATELIELLDSPLFLVPDEEIKSSNEIENIAEAMGLQCNEGCDHNFCRTTLLSMSFATKECDYICEGAGGKTFKLRESLSSRIFVTKTIELRNNSDIIKETKYLEEDINKYKNILNHTRIVKYFGAVKMQTKMFIFMEFAPGGTLYNRIKEEGKGLPHQLIAIYLKQILEGLQYLHENLIIHRDIKPENMLLDAQDNIKLTDFGWSRCLLMNLSKYNNCEISRNDMLTTTCGTPNYMAPEIMIGEPYKYPCDIWSTGATTVAMLTGNRPYPESIEQTVIFKVQCTKRIIYTPTEPMSDDLVYVMKQMLNPLPDKRGTPKSLLTYFVDHFDSTEKITKIVVPEELKNQICFDRSSSMDISHFKRVRKIGNSTNGKCLQMIHKENGDVCAVKCIKLFGEIFNDDSFEIDIKKCRELKHHDRIAKYFGSGRDEETLYLFMEYVENSSIFNQLKKHSCFEEKIITKYCYQVLEGLKFLHDHGIVHGNIKPSNILLDNHDNVRLSDFGLSNILQGTFNYMAPEVMHSNKYDFPADIWSLGATTMEMLTGKMPHHGLRSATVIATTIKNNICFSDTSTPMSNDLREFVKVMGAVDPRKRASAVDLLRSKLFETVLKS